MVYYVPTPIREPEQLHTHAFIFTKDGVRYTYCNTGELIRCRVIEGDPDDRRR